MAPTLAGVDEPGAAVHGFLAELRRAGVAVPVGSAPALRRGARARLRPSRRALYWAGRATLVHRPEDIAPYDQVFARYWLGRRAGVTAEPVPEESVTLATDDADDPEPPEPDVADDDDPGPDLTLRFSRTEVLRARDFATLDAGELAEVEPADGRPAHGRRPPALPPPPAVAPQPGPARPAPHRAGRRCAPAARPVRRLTTVPLRPAPPGRAARRRQRLDGALQPGAPALRPRGGGRPGPGRGVHPRHPPHPPHPGALRPATPTSALARAAAAVPDWSGGTRLGEALRRFNDQWGVRGWPGAPSS